MQQIGKIIKPQKLGSSVAPTIAEDLTAPIGNISSNPIGVGSQIAKALIEFHKTKPFAEEKNQNTFFTKGNKTSTYATLEEVITICRKAVDFDLTFTQNINFKDNEYFVSTIILHCSGETLSDRTPIKCQNYNDPHKFFGGVTYARRYGLMSIFSIPTADNDGISAMGWDKPDPDPDPVDLTSLINNAKTIKELEDLWRLHKPTDEKIKEIFKTKKGELNGR